VADDLGGGNAGRGLRILDVARERVDDVAAEVRAIRRRERRALVAPEIIVNDKLVTVVGQHEIAACALILAVEDQVWIGNNERALRHVTLRLRDKRLARKGIDMGVGGRVGTRAIQGNRGVKYASVIQSGTKKGLKSK
jgi:hypothetical protein